MQALAALPGTHLPQLPEQTGSLGRSAGTYLTQWHFTFPTLLVSCMLGAKSRWCPQPPHLALRGI